MPLTIWNIVGHSHTHYTQAFGYDTSLSSGSSSQGNHSMALGPLQNARLRPILNVGEKANRGPFLPPNGKGGGGTRLVRPFSSSSSSSFLQTRHPENVWMRGLCN